MTFEHILTEMPAVHSNVRIVFVLKNGVEIARHSQVSSLHGILAQISFLMQTLENNDFHVKESSPVTKVLVQPAQQREELSEKRLSVVNMCGKITHAASLHIHNPGVEPYVKKERNNFGVSHAVYTRFCNFHTSNNKSSTLLRAGTSSKAIVNGICHVFVTDSLLDVVVTNIVYNARLGRPVLKNNKRIMRAIKELALGPVLECMPVEECMFVHCVKQELTNPTTLQDLCLTNLHDVSIRINICRTGVVNFFFGLPGGLDIKLEPELHVISVCHTLLQAIVNAT